MDEYRIEDALRAGPPDLPRHREGALERGLDARRREDRAGTTFRATLRPASSAVFFAAAAVVLAIVVVSGFVTASHQPAAIPSAVPTSSPLSSPTGATPGTSPTPIAVGAPAELVDRWVGRVRPIAGLATPATRAILEIQGAELHFDAGQGRQIFDSSVAQVGPGILRLTATTRAGGCEPFDEGTFLWSLSAAGASLRIEVIADACAARAATLAGTWTHTACRDPAQDCLGPLEAGTYASTDFDPFHTGQAGQLSYTVPAGWADTIDHRTNYFLRRTADYVADPGLDGNDTIGGIYIWAGTIAAGQPTDCSAVPASGVAISADAIADHLASLPMLDVVDRGTIRLGTRTARVLDLSLRTTYRADCPFSNGQPFRSLVMFADIGTDGGVWGLGPGGGHRVLLFDVAPGRVVSVWVEGDSDGFAALLRDAMPIIESFELADPSKKP